MGLRELKKRMKGVLVVQTAPFINDGNLDLGAMQPNLICSSTISRISMGHT